MHPLIILLVKGGCLMDSLSSMNKALAYIEEHLTEDIDYSEVSKMSNVEPTGIISASTNFSEGRMQEKGELDHYIGVATSSHETEEFDVLKIDACTWAVFESIGPFPETLQNVWGRIYSEWFPSSGYEAVEGPEILWNESPDTGNPNYRSEIWIPVKKKDH
jgi:AraC family transcriptional regulator